LTSPVWAVEKLADAASTMMAAQSVRFMSERPGDVDDLQTKERGARTASRSPRVQAI